MAERISWAVITKFIYLQMFEEGGEQRDSDPQKCREYDHMEGTSSESDVAFVLLLALPNFLVSNSIFTDSPSVSYLYLYTSVFKNKHLLSLCFCFENPGVT